MRVWTHDRFAYPLPDGHRFPAGGYAPDLADTVDINAATAAEGAARS